MDARGIPPATYQVLPMLICLLGEGYPIQSWMGVPLGTPCPKLDGSTLTQIWDGYPPSGPGTGHPPIQTWDEVPSPVQTWDGVPPCRFEIGYPPLRCGLTHKVKLLHSAILSIWVVNTYLFLFHMWEIYLHLFSIFYGLKWLGTFTSYCLRFKQSLCKQLSYLNGNIFGWNLSHFLLRFGGLFHFD